MKKMSLYKFTHIPLLKNGTLLKQNKKAITQIYQEIKTISRKKKLHLKKKQKQKITKESKRERKKEQRSFQKKKKKEEEEEEEQRRLAHGHYFHLSNKFLQLSFLSILEREHFGGSEEKIARSHKFFSLPSLQQNTYQKSFPSHFLSKVFHPLYFTSK